MSGRKKRLGLKPPGIARANHSPLRNAAPYQNLLAFFLQLKELIGSVRYETTISPLSKKEIA